MSKNWEEMDKDSEEHLINSLLQYERKEMLDILFEAHKSLLPLGVFLAIRNQHNDMLEYLLENYNFSRKDYQCFLKKALRLNSSLNIIITQIGEDRKLMHIFWCDAFWDRILKTKKIKHYGTFADLILREWIKNKRQENLHVRFLALLLILDRAEEFVLLSRWVSRIIVDNARLIYRDYMSK
jgi:hypothetical protein